MSHGRPPYPKLDLPRVRDSGKSSASPGRDGRSPSGASIRHPLAQSTDIMNAKKRPLGSTIRSPSEVKRSRGFENDASSKYATPVSPDGRRSSAGTFDPPNGAASMDGSQIERRRSSDDLKRAPSANRSANDVASTLRNGIREHGSSLSHIPSSSSHAGCAASTHGQTTATFIPSMTPVLTAAPSLLSGKDPPVIKPSHIANMYNYINAEQYQRKLRKEGQLTLPDNMSTLRKLREQKEKLTMAEYERTRKLFSDWPEAVKQLAASASASNPDAANTSVSVAIDNAAVKALEIRVNSQNEKLEEQKRQLQETESKRNDLSRQVDVLQRQIEELRDVARPQEQRTTPTLETIQDLVEKAVQAKVQSQQKAQDDLQKQIQDLKTELGKQLPQKPPQTSSDALKAAEDSLNLKIASHSNSTKNTISRIDKSIESLGADYEKLEKKLGKLESNEEKTYDLAAQLRRRIGSAEYAAATLEKSVTGIEHDLDNKEDGFFLRVRDLENDVKQCLDRSGYSNTRDNAVESNRNMVRDEISKAMKSVSDKISMMDATTRAHDQELSRKIKEEVVTHVKAQLGEVSQSIKEETTTHADDQMQCIKNIITAEVDTNVKSAKDELTTHFQVQIGTLRQQVTGSVDTKLRTSQDEIAANMTTQIEKSKGEILVEADNHSKVLKDEIAQDTDTLLQKVKTEWNDTMSAKITHLESKTKFEYAQVNDRIEKIMHDIDLRPSVSALNDTFGEMFESIGKDLTDVKDTLARAEQNLASQTGEIERLKRESRSGSAHRQTESQPTVPLANLNKLSQKLEDCCQTFASSANLQTLQRSVDEMRQKMVASPDMGVSSTEFETLQLFVNNLRSDLTNEIHTRNTNAANMGTDLAHMEANIQQLHQWAENSTPGAISALHQNFQVLAQRVNGSEERIMASLGSLESRYENISTDELFKRVVAEIQRVYPDAPGFLQQLGTLQASMAAIQRIVGGLPPNLLNTWQPLVAQVQDIQATVHNLPPNLQHTLQSLEMQMQSFQSIKAQMDGLQTRSTEIGALAKRAEDDARSISGRTEANSAKIEEVHEILVTLSKDCRKLSETGGTSTIEQVNKVEENVRKLRLDVGAERKERIGGDASLRSHVKKLEGTINNLSETLQQIHSAGDAISKVFFLEEHFARFGNDVEEGFKSLEVLVNGFHNPIEEDDKEEVEVEDAIHNREAFALPTGPRFGQRRG